MTHRVSPIWSLMMTDGKGGHVSGFVWKGDKYYEGFVFSIDGVVSPHMHHEELDWIRANVEVEMYKALYHKSNPSKFGLSDN